MIARKIWIFLTTVTIHRKVVEEDDVREERGKLNFMKTPKSFFREWIHLIVYFLPLFPSCEWDCAMVKFNSISSQFSTLNVHNVARLGFFSSVKLIPLKAYFSFKSPTLPWVCCSWLSFQLIVLVRAWLRVSHYVLMLFSCLLFGLCGTITRIYGVDSLHSTLFCCRSLMAAVRVHAEWIKLVTSRGNQFIRCKIDLCVTFETLDWIAE